MSEPCDLVVVGHGAAGLAAALAAAEASPGARIMVFERTPQSEAGGGTRWSPANMRLKSTSEIVPGFVDDMMEASAGRGDAAYFRRLAEEAPAAAQWAEQHGVKFHSPGYYLSAGPPRIQPVGGGGAIVEALSRAAASAGVSFRYGSRVQRLVLGARGAVEGVEVAFENGSVERVTAGAVVLANGGFQGSPSMLRQYLGDGAETLRPITRGSAYNEGDGIRMALEAGALPSGDWGGMHSEPVDPRSTGPAPVVLVYPYGIVVDREGRRFLDEGRGLVHETWEQYSRAIHFNAPGRTAWAILDSRLYQIEGYERAIRSEVPPVQAESIEALATLIGVPEASLRQTIAAYNAACAGDRSRFDATREDGLAATRLTPAKSNWARPLDRPPFLAWPLVGAIAYTFGGVATNANAEVMGKNGPIPGLYAAGEMTGHFYGSAPNAVAVLRALVFGRIAGRAAIAATNPNHAQARQAR